MVSRQSLDNKELIQRAIRRFENPPSRPVDASQDRMRDELNQALGSTRADLAAARLSATYEVLTRHSDLANPELAEDERLRRAENLLSTYGRLRKVKADFRDTGDELRAARRIQKAAYRERQRAKREAPAVRGRPRKLHI